LGKVLFVIATGQNASQFPELPTFGDGSVLPDEFFEFNNILLKACAFDPKDRYPSARAMQEDLQRCQAGQPIPSPHAEPARPRRTRAWALSLAAAMLALLAGGIGTWVQTQRNKERVAAVNSSTALPEKVAHLPAAPALAVLYAETLPLSSASVARPKLELQLLAKRKSETEFHRLNDGDLLASEVDDYLMLARASVRGYLYIFQVDSAGKTDWFFPQNNSSKLSSGANPIQADQIIQVPGADRGWLYLDQRTGTEHIYFTFSLDRWTKLEEALGQSGPPPSAASVVAAQDAHVNEPFGLGTRGALGIRPAAMPLPAAEFLDRVQGGQTFKLPLSSQVFEASGSRLVIERWFQHVAR
jgi:hypothetical protein